MIVFYFQKVDSVDELFHWVFVDNKLSVGRLNGAKYLQKHFGVTFK